MKQVEEYFCAKKVSEKVIIFFFIRVKTVSTFNMNPHKKNHCR